LPFPFGKGSRAALEGAASEQGGASREHAAALREKGGSTEGVLWGSAGAQ